MKTVEKHKHAFKCEKNKNRILEMFLVQVKVKKKQVVKELRK